MKYFLIGFLILRAISSGAQNKFEQNKDSLAIEYQKQKEARKKEIENRSITHFVMKNEDDTFGYSIFIDGNMTYHQPNIPAVSGNKGFDKVDHADAVARLTIQKIKEGESPPTLSVEEVENVMKN